LLEHACKAIYPGCSFLHHAIALLNRPKNPRQYVRTSIQTQFSGKHLLAVTSCWVREMEMTSDASESWELVLQLMVPEQPYSTAIVLWFKGNRIFHKKICCEKKFNSYFIQHMEFLPSFLLLKLIIFVAYLSCQNLLPQTIKTYLAGIRHTQIVLGQGASIFSLPWYRQSFNEHSPAWPQFQENQASN